MFNLIPRTYDAPKWQAKVSDDQAFRFANGHVVHTLLDFKHALMNLPEDVITHHLGNDHHDFSAWVRGAVGDDDLAAALEKYNHRWGLIVALERQMMRTLNLPVYVAQRWLGQAPAPFTFASGETVHSLPELGKALDKVSDQTIEFHMERVPNDIAKWVNDVVGDYELADLLEEASNRAHMSRLVTDHLAMLQEAAEE